MSPPSRMLPQRAWAASTPTLLSHEAFDNLLKQTPIQQLPLHVPLSSLERFLGCKFLRRHITRVISQENHLTSVPTTEPNTNIFKAETLQFKIILNSSTLQTFHMKIQPLPGIYITRAISCSDSEEKDKVLQYGMQHAKRDFQMFA